MNNMWQYFPFFFFTFLGFWLLGFFFMFIIPRKQKKDFSVIFPIVAIAILLLFIILLWYDLNRPPLKTMAETRLWYSFFSALIIFLLYLKTKNKILYFTGFIMSIVFLTVEIFHPEYRMKNLMPALQSPWFIPHVIIYIISYSILGSAWVILISDLFISKTKRNIDQSIKLSMTLIYPGFALLCIGMIFGALWAKIAWGDYWAWDPKETWALLTVLFYLLVIHYYKHQNSKSQIIYGLISFSFVILIITWLGIRYFPSAAASVHVYGN